MKDFNKKFEEYNKKKFGRIDTLSVMLIFLIVWILIFNLFIPNFIYKKIIVVGDSMRNTIIGAKRPFDDKNDECEDMVGVLLSKNIQIGDIVVFDTHNDTDPFHIKRVIALENDWVSYEAYEENGKTYYRVVVERFYKGVTQQIRLFDEQYVLEPIDKKPNSFDKVQIKKGEFYALGDNRNNSQDSRGEGINYKIDDIVGIAKTIYRPIWSRTILGIRLRYFKTIKIENPFNY